MNVTTTAWSGRFGSAEATLCLSQTGPIGRASAFGSPVVKPLRGAAVAVTADRVICSGARGHLHGYDLAGKRCFVAAPPAEIGSSAQTGPIVIDGIVIMVLMQGMAGYDAQTGERRWVTGYEQVKQALGRRLPAHFLLYFGWGPRGVLAHAAGDALLLVAPHDGALRVLVPAAGPGIYAIAGGYGIHSGDTFTLVHIEEPTRPLLDIGRGGAITRGLRVDDIYVVLDDAWLTACDLRPPAIRWRIPAYMGERCECFGSLACDGEVLYYRYARDREHVLVALNLGDGSLRWRREGMPSSGNKLNAHSLAVSAERLIYIAGTSVLVLDKNDGSTVWASADLADRGTKLSGPSLGHGRVWISAADTGVRVID